MIVEAVSTNSISSAVSHRMIDIVLEEYPDGDINDLLNIQESIENSTFVKNITSQYIDSLAHAIANNESVEYPDISDDINQLIDESIEIIEKNMNANWSNEKTNAIKEQLKMKSGDFASALQTYSQSLVNNPSNEKVALMKIYTVFNSMIFKVISFIVICVLIICIYLSSHSLSLTLKNVSIPIFISGVEYIVSTKLISNVAMSLTNRFLGRTMLVDTSLFFIVGIVLCVIGIILFAGYFILHKQE